MEKVCTNCLNLKPITDFHRKLKGTASHCKDCKRDYSKSYRTNNADSIRNQRRSFRRANPEVNKARCAKRYKDKKREVIVAVTKYTMKRYHTDEVYKFRFAISSQLRDVLRKPKRYSSKSRMYSIVGLIGDDLFNYLWGTFEFNYGIPRNWIKRSDVEIDHIIPKSTATSIEEVKKLNHYTNLQLLLKEDNTLKRDKIIGGTND